VAEVDTLLMIWFKNSHYNENTPNDDVRTYIYGQDGPCDSAGYRIEPVQWWKDNMSSILGYNNCDTVEVTNKAFNSSTTLRIAGHPLEAYTLWSYNDNVGITRPKDG
jgi:hypothetical protein